MSNDPLSSTADTAVTDAEEMEAVKNDPVLHGHSALNDPNLSGSTAADWTGTGGPDPGGMAGLTEQAGDASSGNQLQQAAGSAADQMQQAAGQVADQAKQAVGPAADQAQQAAGQVADQAQQMAGQVMDTAKTQTTNRLSMGKDQIAGTAGAVAEALRQSSQGLRDQDQGAVAGYVEQAADRLDGAADYLRQRDVPQLVDEVEGFARRQPALFLGAAFGLGILAARFIKSSRQQAQGSTSSSSQGTYRGGSYGGNDLDTTTTSAWTGTQLAESAGYQPAPLERGEAAQTAEYSEASAPSGRVTFRAEAPLPADQISGDSSTM